MIPKKCCGMKILIQKKNKLMKGDKMKTITNTIRQYFLMLTLVCVGVMTAQAATYTVTNANDSGAGSLRDAINQANATPVADTINFSSSLDGQTITLLSALPNLANNGTLTITGNGATNTIISGSNAFRVLRVSAGANVIINGVTVRDARGGGFGAAISSSAISLTINDSAITNNVSTGTGSALAVSFGAAILNRVTISNNSGGNVSGIYLQDGTLNINDSTISGNTGGWADVIRVFDGGGTTTLTMVNSTISGNTSTFNNAGITLQTGNSAATSIVNLTNCTITNNSVSGNTTRAAIWLQPGAGTNVLNLNNTIVSGNLANGAPADIEGMADPSSSFNLIGTGGGLTNGVNSNIVGINDPGLAPLADNGGPTFTHALLAGSPAIDAGNSTLTTDQRGFARPYDSPLYPNAANGSDIGAFEYQGASPTSRDQCKNGGWMTFDSPHTFKNQGDCIQFVNTGK
jgi:hypothetical protein